MTRRNKWLIGSSAGVGFVAIVAAWLYWAVAPAYVEQVIRDSLRERGFAEAEFSLESVSFDRLSLRDLRLDADGRATARRVVIDYELSELLDGRVRIVTLIGAALRVGVSSDYDVDWGPLAKMRSAEGAERLPLSRLELVDSVLVVDAPGRAERVPLYGDAVMTGGVVRFDLRGSVFREPMHVRGNLDLSAEAGSAMVEVLAPRTLPTSARDAVMITAHYETVGGQRHLELGIRGRRASLGGGGAALRVSGLSGHLDVELLGAQIRGARGQLSAAALSVRGVDVGDPQIRIAGDDSGLALAAAGRVDGLDVAANTTLSPRPNSWRHQRRFEIDWSVDGIPSERRVRWLADAGVRVRQLGAVDARGHSVVEIERRSGSRWRVDIDGARLRVDAAALSVPAAGLAVEKPVADLVVSARIDAAGFRVALGEGTKVIARSLRWGELALERARRSRAGLELRIDRDRPATFSWSERGAPWSFRAPRFRAKVGVNLRYKDALRVDGLRGAALMSVTEGPERSDVRLTWSRVTADTLTVSDAAFPRVTAQIRGRSKRLSITATSRLTDSATISAAMVLDRRRARTTCPIEIELPATQVRENDRVARLIRSVAPLAASGTIGATADLDLCAQTIDGRVRLSLADVAVVDAEDRVGLYGLDGTLTLSSLAQLSTAGWQQLAWDRTTLGDREFGRGSAIFRARDGALDIERAALAIGGGQLWSSPFVFDPNDIDIRTTVHARSLSVKKWLPIVSRGKAEGSGRLSGQLSVRLQFEPQLNLDVIAGHLSAQSPGHFAVADRAALEKALDRYAAGFGADGDTSEMIKDRIIGGLQDFGYSRFDATIEPGDKDPVLTIETRGKGRKIPQELDLTVNVRGFSEVINPALRAWIAQ